MNVARSFLLIMTALSIAPSAVLAQEIITERDEFTGAATIRFEEPVRVWGGRESGSQAPIIGLDLWAVREEGGTIHYGIMAHYWGPTWMFVNDGADGTVEPSLIFLVDGDRVPLSPRAGSAVRQVGVEGVAMNMIFRHGAVHERVFYPVDPETIRIIANSQEVKLRLYGSTGYVDRFLHEGQLKAFRHWVDDVLAPALPASKREKDE